MGYSAYSHAAYGFPISKQKLESKQKIRGCTHTQNENNKFCSECGEPMFKESKISILDSLGEDYNKANGLTFFVESGDALSDSNYEVIIGFLLGETGYNKNRFNMRQPTDYMRQELLNFIKEHNLNVMDKHIQTIVFTYHSY